MILIYIGANSNEVREILGSIKLKEGELMDYFFTKDGIETNEFFQGLAIINIPPIPDGKEIQDALKLRFNPMSVISRDLTGNVSRGPITEDEIKNLEKKLAKENGLNVAIVNDRREVEHCARKNYDGYQGGFE